MWIALSLAVPLVSLTFALTSVPAAAQTKMPTALENTRVVANTGTTLTLTVDSSQIVTADGETSPGLTGKLWSGAVTYDGTVYSCGFAYLLPVPPTYASGTAKMTLHTDQDGKPSFLTLRADSGAPVAESAGCKQAGSE